MFSIRILVPKVSDSIKSTSRHLKLLGQQQKFLLSTHSKSESDAARLRWSYVCGPATNPLRGETIGQIVELGANKFGDREALVSVHQGVRKSFIDVHKESDEIAAAFLALGLKPGDRLGIWGPNSYEWYLTQLAAGKAGLILVNINPSYRPDELKFCLKKVSVKAIICGDSFKTSNYYQMLSQLTPELTSCTAGHLKNDDLPDLKIVISMSQNNLSGTYRFEDLFGFAGSDSKKDLDKLTRTIQFDEPCNIQFTSGTTGQPKGAVLSHHNIVNNAYGIGGRGGYGLEKDVRICVPVPLYHCFGCVGGTLMALIYGSTVVMPNYGFDPVAIADALENERITSCYGTPTMFVDILAQYDKKPFDAKHLHAGIMAGAMCPEELVLDLFEKLNMKDLLVMYGMTETSPVTMQCFPTDSLSIRTTTVGYPSDHTEAKIVDDEGRVVPTGTAGELLIRGYCNFLGYWEDEAKTLESFTKDRWFKSGDLATLDDGGYCKIVGRIKDMIIRGGENIYPAEIENFYMSHSEIREAQVFGIPDARMGEEVAMWVKAKDNSKLTQDDLKMWAKEKIAHYKIPKHIFFKSEFPTTVTGKIQKFTMRDTTLKELGLS